MSYSYSVTDPHPNYYFSCQCYPVFSQVSPSFFPHYLLPACSCPALPSNAIIPLALGCRNNCREAREVLPPPHSHHFWTYIPVSSFVCNGTLHPHPLTPTFTYPPPSTSLVQRADSHRLHLGLSLTSLLHPLSAPLADYNTISILITLLK